MTKEDRKIAYYPGCSLNSTSMDYNVSIKKLLGVLEIGFEEIEDWNCCGTTPAHHTSEELSLVLSARNLLLAREMGYEEILCPCVSCYNKLMHAAKVLGSSDETLNEFELEQKASLISDLEEMDFSIEKEYNFKVYSILEFLVDHRDLIKEKYQQVSGGKNYQRPGILSELVPACYYGCALLRPRERPAFDSVENPTSMEKLLADVGIKCTSFQFKTECCGAILSLTNKDVVLGLSKKIIDTAIGSGANSFVVFCQLCQQNLDLRQSQINSYFGKNYHIPVLYLTQVLGMALGLSEKEVMLESLFVKPVIKKGF
ncbi:MAG: CoB--CoM heterodisulfide reductase iron-sulfur subunit B family protein [Actinomycetota bacterium]